MEIGDYRIISERCAHPYSRALIDALPTLDKREEDRAPLEGETPSPIHLPSGCRFHPRCPYAKEVCRSTEPELRELNEGHSAACHFAGALF